MRNITRAGILMMAATCTLFIGLSPAGADHGGPHCDDLPADITPDHPDWDDSLDTDDDGVGCESDGGGGNPAPAPAPVPGPAPAPAPAPAAQDDLNCGDPGTSHNMPVGPDDPHGLDGDGDGVGCEDGSVFDPAPAAPAEPQVREPTYTG